MANFICKGRGNDFVPMIDFMPDGVHIAIVEHHKTRFVEDDFIAIGDYGPRILAVYNNDEQGHERAQADLDKMLAERAPKSAPIVKAY